MTRLLRTAPLTTSLLLFAATAPAAPKEADRRLQVLMPSSTSNFKQARALGAALKRGALRLGFELQKGEYSLEVLGPALDCKEPPDKLCLDKIAIRIQSRRFVWGSLTKEGEDMVVVLHLHESRKPEREVKLRYSKKTAVNDTELDHLAEGALATLTGRDQGEIVVQVGKLSGRVFLDGKPLGELKDGTGSFEVQAGDHVLVVESPGHERAETKVHVDPGERAEVELLPQKRETKAAKPVERAPVAEEQQGKTSLRPIIGWSAIGVGGALAAAGAFFWFDSSQQSNDEVWKSHLALTPSNRNPCEWQADGEIQALCDANSRSRLLALTLMPVGAILAGAGVYLLATAPKQTAGVTTPRWRPHADVAVGPGATNVQLRWAF